MHKEILIWDSCSPVSNTDKVNKTIIFWCGYSTSGLPSSVSIPVLVEDNAESLRKRYLSWIYETSQTIIRGKPLVDYLQLRPGLSSWWISLLAEKCNVAKSPQINDAIRLLAFTDWMHGKSAERLVLVSSNPELSECLHNWCRQQGISFVWRRQMRNHIPLSPLRQFYAILPNFLRALIWLAHQIQSYQALYGVGQKAWRQTQGKITFVSYLFNLLPDSASKGIYESAYWGHLPDLLLKEGIKTNWLHLYVKNSFLPTSKEAAAQIRSFNQASCGLQNHVTLDSFMSMTVLGHLLRDWLTLIFRTVGLRMHANIPLIGDLDLWPLLRKDWHNSISGTAAMSNLLSLNLFESAFSEITKQDIGVHLLENQGWEFGMRQAWKSNHHGQVIGCVHSTVRYWDLRYFYDRRTYQANQLAPMPDQVAVNGPAARNSYLGGGYPVEQLIELEALRYLYLNQINPTSRGDSVSETLASFSNDARTRLLVVCDYLDSHTRVQMELLNEVAEGLPPSISIVVKPHPANPVNADDYPGLSFTPSLLPINKLLPEADIVYAGPVTSAAVDAYCANLPVIIVLDRMSLNMSPLRGWPGVTFVGSAEELSMALRNAAASLQSQTSRPCFFNLDRSLAGWQKLLFDREY